MYRAYTLKIFKLKRELKNYIVDTYYVYELEDPIVLK